MLNTEKPHGFAYRRIFFVAAAFMLSLLSRAGAAEAASQCALTLRAIHLLENPFDRRTPGPRGELGAYQFRATTWHQYTRQPLALALNRATSDAIAIRHYEWIRVNLARAGIRPTPYAIALAWNGGLAAELHGHTSAPARDYARRADALEASFAGEFASAYP